MEYLTKFLASLDPDYWETYEHTYDQNCREVTTICSEENFKRLHEKECKRIFNFLSLDDLKNCRVVCSYWNELIVNSLFKTKTCFILDGERFKWRFYTSRNEDLKYVSTSKFSSWTSMRVRKVSTDNLKFLIANYQFLNAVKHISHVQLVECCFEWEILIKFLLCFENLESFEDIKGQYYMSQPYVTKFTNWLRKVDPRSVGDICNTLSYFPEKQNSLRKLKDIVIIEAENSPSVTEDIIKILNSTTGAIDQVTLEVGKFTGMNECPQRQTEYWTNILHYLRMKDIKKLKILSSDAVHVGFSNRFLKYFSHWQGVPGSAFSKLTNLEIDIKPIQLWTIFQDEFIPFIQSLKNLRLLSLKMITMRESQQHLVIHLSNAIPQNCVLKLGITVDDYGGLIAAYQIQLAMLQKLYFDSLITLHIVIMTDSIVEASELLPAVPGINFNYQHVKDLTITKKFTTCSSFYTYSIDVVIRTFPNLTQLCIFDEHSTTSQQSGALIVDDDIQLIVKNLSKLEKLILTANMIFLSDAGMTGQSKVIYRKKNQWNKKTDKSRGQHKIYSFSNLRNIKHISLDGLGSLITDNTAYHAFNGTQRSLQLLRLTGEHEISETGKSYLHANFSKFSNCTVVLS